jgi:hypothetical protein
VQALRPRGARRPPGSYAWSALRKEAERRFAAGELPRHVIDELQELVAGYGPSPPSRRTMMRWYAERRWLRSPARTDGRAAPGAPSRGVGAP